MLGKTLVLACNFKLNWGVSIPRDHNKGHGTGDIQTI